jgi:hypothetical protein
MYSVLVENRGDSKRLTERSRAVKGQAAVSPACGSLGCCAYQTRLPL